LKNKNQTDDSVMLICVVMALLMMMLVAAAINCHPENPPDSDAAELLLPELHPVPDPNF